MLENKKLRAVFLSEYGGRLYSLVDLETGRELLFENPVFQPANLAARNAWFSGGIEWNVSQYGDSIQTCEPLYFAKVLGGDGEYFFQTPKSVVSPFEVVVYDDSFIFFERSTNVLRYRKMFCWGSLKGRKKWESFLSKEGEGEYVEIQAGLANTQVNGFDMGCSSIIEFLQIFSFDNLKDKKSIESVYDKNYLKARSIVESIVNKNINEEVVTNQFKKYSARSENKIVEILSMGSGFGALEDLRREKSGEKKSPKSMIFPVCSIDKKLLTWIKLLNDGFIEEIETNTIDLCFMIDENFKKLFEKIIDDKKI